MTGKDRNQEKKTADITGSRNDRQKTYLNMGRE